jgi:uncharacterized membrane protein YjfL (UPF0719 family)
LTHHFFDFADLAQRLAACLGWTMAGVLIFYAGAWFYDLLDPIDYKKEIENGNIAAALKMAAVTLAIAAIVVAAIVT